MNLTVRLRGVVRTAAAMVAFTASLTSTAAAQQKVKRLGEAHTATVRIVALCSNKIDFRCNLKLFKFRDHAKGTDLADRFHFGSGAAVPYGTYEAIAYFEDAWPAIPIALGTVEVSQPEVLVVADLRPQPPGSPRMKLQFPTASDR